MGIKFTKIKAWISSSFQVITLGLLIFTVVIVLKQQNDIHKLQGLIDDVYYKVDQTNENVNHVSSKLDGIESDIERLRKTVIIWGH